MSWFLRPPTDSDRELKEKIVRRAMRRALYKWLWEQTHRAKPSRHEGKMIPSQPMPSMTDAEIKRRLQELTCGWNL